ncbi:hypothetical protein [Geodermatophilus sp. DF01-2]|uniref:hypothetical protein n=1 Tax=Geodermatophilus sp. DF01-2 TaxID=2559610 RepID=UPI00143114D0|nr:hypothetical protein [Geodermatophilus sp. DF01_2]
MDGLSDFRPDEGSERLGQDGAHALVADEDLLEEGLVVEPANAVASSQVRLVAVTEQLQGELQALLDGFRGLIRPLKPVLDVSQLAGDAVLFDLQ